MHTKEQINEDDLVCNPQPWLRPEPLMGACSWVFSKPVRVSRFETRDVKRYGAVVRVRVGNRDQLAVESAPAEILEGNLILPSQEPGVVLTVELVGFDGEIRPIFEVRKKKISCGDVPNRIVRVLD